MKFQIMSDLHLEFKPEKFPLISSESDALVIAGDFSTDEADFPSFIENYVRDFTDVPVLFVLGNHDYYGKLFNNAAQDIKKMVEGLENVYVLDNETITIKGVKFVGTTLWTDFDKRSCEASALASMPDYRKIKKLGSHYEIVNIATDDIYQKYQDNLVFLSDALDSNLDTVVITHHIPSFQFVDPYFAGSLLNGAFYANLDQFVIDRSPEAWVCGHTHRHFIGKLGGTTVHCNPWGYPHEGHKYYVEELLIEV